MRQTIRRNWPDSQTSGISRKTEISDTGQEFACRAPFVVFDRFRPKFLRIVLALGLGDAGQWS